MANLKVQNNLTVNGDIINNKMDYQLDQTITVTDQSKVFIPVDFNKYDYKLVMLLAPTGGDANMSIRCANNNVILAQNDRWIFQGNAASDSNTSSAVVWYRHQTNAGDGYIYLIDNVGAEGRYSDIKVELTWGRSTTNTIFYQSRASRTYAGNFEYKDANIVQ